MPSPSASLATLRPELAASLEEFNLAMDRQGFIGQRVLPIFEVAKSNGTFGVLPIEQLLQNQDVLRAPGAGYNRGSFKFETGNYTTQEYGWEEPVDDNEAENYSDYLDAEMVATQRAFDFVLRAQERRVAEAVFNATTFTSQSTALTNEWDDATNATPINDVETAIRTVRSRCGIVPDTLIVNWSVFRNLRLCTQIIERITASGAGSPAKPTDVTLNMLKACFDLPKIFVAGAIQNTANIGQAASLSDIWSSEYAMVCKTADTGDLREPCLGRTMHWGQDGSSVGGTVESYREEQTRGNIVRVRHQVGEKLIYTPVAQLLSNVTT